MKNRIEMINSETAIKAIKEKIEKLSEVRKHSQFENWQKATSSTLSNIYPKKQSVITKFESIKSWVFVYSGSGDRTSDAIIEAKEYLNSLISDIENFGLSHQYEKSQTESVSVNVHQHNEQNQSTTVSINIDFIIDVLKGELRTSEIEEIKEILESNVEPKEKKKKFIEKIKSFGNDVATNILANILTNPEIYSALGQL